MSEGVHDRAIRMISAEQVEGLTEEQRRWLSEHLSTCHGCARKADAVARALSSLRSVSVEMNPTLAAATQRLIRCHAAVIEERRSRLFAVWVATAFSLLWMTLSGPFFWRGFEWLGRSQGWADAVWQSTFLLGWFLPATAVALVLALMRGQKPQQLEN